MTEAFSWLVTFFGVGAAIGTAAAGPAVELGGTASGFGVACVAGASALLVLTLTQRVMAAPGRTRTVAGSPSGSAADADAGPGADAGERAGGGGAEGRVDGPVERLVDN